MPRKSHVKTHAQLPSQIYPVYAQYWVSGYIREIYGVNRLIAEIFTGIFAEIFGEIFGDFPVI